MKRSTVAGSGHTHTKKHCNKEHASKKDKIGKRWRWLSAVWDRGTWPTGISALPEITQENYGTACSQTQIPSPHQSLLQCIKYWTFLPPLPVQSLHSLCPSMSTSQVINVKGNYFLCWVIPQFDSSHGISSYVACIPSHSSTSCHVMTLNDSSSLALVCIRVTHTATLHLLAALLLVKSSNP